MVQPALATVLVVDGDDDLRHEVAERLAGRFARVLQASSAEIAVSVWAAHEVHVVAASARLRGMGADGLCAARDDRDVPPVVIYDVAAAGFERSRWFGAGGADCMAGRDPALVVARCRRLVRGGAGRHPSPSLGRMGRRRLVPGILRWR